jgi:hypothetical protein
MVKWKKRLNEAVDDAGGLCAHRSDRPEFAKSFLVTVLNKGKTKEAVVRARASRFVLRSRCPAGWEIEEIIRPKFMSPVEREGLVELISLADATGLSDRSYAVEQACRLLRESMNGYEV